MTIPSLPGETWAAIPEFVGVYEVSTLGRVRSLPRPRVKRMRLMAVWINKDNHYPSVTLSLGKHKQANYTVHTLVMLAFVGPCPLGMQVGHVNGVRAESVLTNLKYCTPTENMEDVVRHGHNENANKTVCKYGHELTGDNVLLSNGGKHRQCRQCAARRIREFKARKRAERGL